MKVKRESRPMARQAGRCNTRDATLTLCASTGREALFELCDTCAR